LLPFFAVPLLICEPLPLAPVLSRPGFAFVVSFSLPELSLFCGHDFFCSSLYLPLFLSFTFPFSKHSKIDSFLFPFLKIVIRCVTLDFSRTNIAENNREKDDAIPHVFTALEICLEPPQGHKDKVTKPNDVIAVSPMKNGAKEKRALNISPCFGPNCCPFCMNKHIIWQTTCFRVTESGFSLLWRVKKRSNSRSWKISP